MSWHLASSRALDPQQAAAELSLRLKPEAALALVLCSHDYAPQALAEALAGVLGATPWLGMAVQGLQIGDENLTQGVAVAQFLQPGLKVGLSQALPAGTPDRLAGELATRQALEALPAAAETLIVLLDPQAGSAAETLYGALDEAGSGPAWIGGGTGHAQGPGFLLVNGCVSQGQVVVAALSHERPWGAGVAQGWVPTGASATVTLSQRAILSELDYLTAYQAYTEMARRDGLRLDPEAFSAFARSHPLGIPLASGHYLLRLPLSHDRYGALHCGAEIPAHCLVQLMTGHPPSLIEASGQAAKRAYRLCAEPVAALAFNDSARQDVLGRRRYEEQSLILRELRQIPLLSAVCIGQIGSFGGVPHYHNQALALLVVGT